MASTNPTENLEAIIYVSWEESERGWGTRPDGCSLHLSEGDFKAYLADYWDSMPDEVPDEYERPAGSPVKAFVDEELYLRIEKSRNGIRLYSDQEAEAVSSKSIQYGSERSGWVSR